MYGGSISGNDIGVNMHGSMDNDGDKFHMYGGSITGNGRGVNVKNNHFIVAGDVTITGNTSGNVCLSSDKTITVGGALGENASIVVTTEKTVNEGNYVTVAKGKSKSDSPGYTLTEADLTHIESDNKYGKWLNGNSVVFTKGDPHIHAVCGYKDCGDHTNEQWLPISSETELRNAQAGGHYYLTKGIDLYNNAWKPKDGVVLCLNGQSITAKGGFDAIEVGNGVTFTLTDCSSQRNGEFTHYKPKTGCVPAARSRCTTAGSPGTR